MHLADFIPAFAAVTCWEFSLAYFVISRRISRRPVNLTYAVLSFFVGDMNYFDLMLLDTRDRHADLIWYYFHYAAVYGIAVTWIYFLPLMIRRPLPLPLTPRRVAYVLIVLCLGQFSPEILHVAPPYAPTTDFNRYVWGPLYPLYASLPMFVGGGSSLWAVPFLFRRAPAAAPAKMDDEGTLWASNRDIALILWAAAAVILSGSVELVQQVWLPNLRFSLNPRAIGSIVFCALTAWTLWRAILRSKEQHQRTSQERLAFDTLAQVRLQATYDIQHQIKNRLVAVELPLRNALRDERQGVPPAVQQGRLVAALDEVRHLFHALDVMLNAARLAAGEPVHLGPKRAADAVALVEDTRRRRTEWEQERRASGFGAPGPQWEFSCDARLDPPDVFLHADDLDHVLAVLLDNAVKYSPAGGEVALRLWAERGRLRLSVSDQGLGIAPGDLDRIGTRAFFRGEVGPHSIGGTGVGLYLARRLVEAQGGRLWAESTLGSGSDFHISLPLERVDMAD